MERNIEPVEKTYLVRSDDVGIAICKGLGIDPDRVTRVSFVCDANIEEHATFTVTMIGNDAIPKLDWLTLVSTAEIEKESME